MVNILDKGINTTIPSSLAENSKESIRNFDTIKIISNAKEMTRAIIESKEFKYNLSEYKQMSDIFSHSVRVAAFSVLLAKHYNDTLENVIQDEKSLEKTKIDLEAIAAAAMMHDIGKICKDESVLQKILVFKIFIIFFLMSCVNTWFGMLISKF